MTLARKIAEAIWLEQSRADVLPEWFTPNEEAYLSKLEALIAAELKERDAKIRKAMERRIESLYAASRTKRDAARKIIAKDSWMRYEEEGDG